MLKTSLKRSSFMAAAAHASFHLPDPLPHRRLLCFPRQATMHVATASPTVVPFPAALCTPRLLPPAVLGCQAIATLDMWGVLLPQSPGLEADDIIATLAVRALAEGCHVTIASPDKVPPEAQHLPLESS